jgi:hypothetical protein
MTMTSLYPDPGDIRTWTPEQRRRHRLRRALHELMAHPAYSIDVSGGMFVVGPKDAITAEARGFIAAHRADLIEHEAWLQRIDLKERGAA